MTAASGNKDDEDRRHNNLYKCFPARTSLHRKRDGAGHWLVAYRKVEEQKHNHLQRRIKESYKKCSSCCSRVVGSPLGGTLDGAFLLQLHGIDKPSELCSSDISERKLNTVKPDDLKAFHNVAYIDACVNSLSLESFSSFASLRELNLSLNGLSDMTFDAADFPHLQVLDLSFNSLTADCVVSIGRLPCLKVLHLTGNDIHRLPPDLGYTGQDSSHQPKNETRSFQTLEVLMLDDNKLSSSVFNSLANLLRLKHLDLQGNRITQIPYLQPAGLSESSFDAPAENALDLPCETSKILSQMETCEEELRGGGGGVSPLPELQFLNLSNNKIMEEEALLAAALFPKLCEIDICCNPLTTRRSGDPPLLRRYLGQGLGIKIKRKQTAGNGKCALRASVDPKWKVDKRIPKVSKRPLLSFCPDQNQAEQCGATTSQSAGIDGEDESLQENTEHFFVTQGVELPQHASDPQSSEKKKGNENAAERFKLGGLLMDVKPSLDGVEHIGIQTAVRMLEHTLKNLNVYRDPKPKPDCIQTPRGERQRRIKEPPPSGPIKPPAERLDKMIEGIRESRTTRRAPLSRVLHTGRAGEPEHREALLLLREVKNKCKLVRRRTPEQVTGGNADKNVAGPPT